MSGARSIASGVSPPGDESVSIVRRCDKYSDNDAVMDASYIADAGGRDILATIHFERSGNMFGLQYCCLFGEINPIYNRNLKGRLLDVCAKIDSEPAGIQDSGILYSWIYDDDNSARFSKWSNVEMAYDVELQK